MSQSIATAVLTRWDAVGLDTTVDTLYWASKAPESDVLPRVVFQLTTINRRTLTRGSLMKTGRLRFQMWGKTPELVQGYIDAIQPLFHNSDKAATDPLVSTADDTNITECLYADSANMEEDDNVYQGVIEFDIEWQETNTVPS